MLRYVLAPVLLCVVGGAEPQAADDAFQAALVAAVHRFAEEGELDHLKAIAEKYPKVINARQTFRQPHKPLRTDGFTPLHRAAERGREQVAAYLLQKRADVNSADGLGWTPLHLAAQQGNPSLVKLLVKHGAKVEAKTVAIPEEFGIPPNSPPDAKPRKLPAVPARTPLKLAERNKHADVVQYLKTLDD